MMDLKETFKRQLKAYMALAGKNAEQLAKDADISVDAVRKYTSGAQLPLFETAFKIAQALGCTPNDLCGISLNKPN